jgi:hypothetical protein
MATSESPLRDLAAEPADYFPDAGFPDPGDPQNDYLILGDPTPYRVPPYSPSPAEDPPNAGSGGLGA